MPVQLAPAPVRARVHTLTHSALELRSMGALVTDDAIAAIVEVTLFSCLTLNTPLQSLCILLLVLVLPRSPPPLLPGHNSSAARC